VTRIVVVEDHTLVRQSLVRTINAEAGFEVVGESDRGDRAIETIVSLEPDLILLDIEMPGGDGLSVATEIKKKLPLTKIVFLTMHDEDSSIRRAVGLGVEGFLPKTASTEELLQALRVVSEGGSYLSPSVARRVMELVESRRSRGGNQLTDRELEVLQLLTQGRRPQEMAEALFVALKTVKNHLTSIYSKLGVETGTQAVAEAYRQGLVSPPSSRMD